MVVPLFLPLQAFEEAPPTDAKIPRYTFSASCFLFAASGSMRFMTGDPALGLWQLLVALSCGLTLRKTIPSMMLVLASLFGVELMLSLINLTEQVWKQVLCPKYH